MIPFLDGFVGAFGFGGGQAMGSSLLDMSLSPINATLDSLGLSQHGRDQYFNANLQREFLEKQMQFQREMLGYNQNFTKEMYDRQWSDMLSKYPELAQKLNDQQFNLWKNQFQMQNEWNSPGNQQMLLMAAGRNPVANAQGMSAQSSMGASSAATPPQISPTPFSGNGSPIGLPQGLSGRGTTIADIGSFLKDISQMRLNNKQAGRYDEKMDADIQAALAKAGLDKATSDYQKLLTSVDSFYLPREKSSQVKLNMALAAKAAAEGNDSEAHARLNDAMTELEKTKNKEAKARLPFVELKCRAEIDEINATAAEKRANAKKAAQEAETEKYMTKLKKIEADRESLPDVRFGRVAALIAELQRNEVLSLEQRKEAWLRIDKLKGMRNWRDLNAFNKGIDNLLTWLSEHIGVAINGSISVKE